MATFAEVIVPFAIAAFAGYTDFNRCTPESHPDPLAENMCGTYRNALGQACTSMLSVPVPGASMSLAAKRTISPIAFSAEVKNSIRAAYEVCTSYWTGTIGYEEFLRQTAEKVSVLNMLYGALPLKSGLPPSPFTDLAQAQGVSAERVEAAKQQREQEFTCGPGAKCDSAPPSSSSNAPANTDEGGREDKAPSVPPSPWKKDLALLENRLTEAIRSARGPGLREREWRLLTETNFAFADARLTEAACGDFARRARLGRAVSGVSFRIRVIGYADSTGETPFNVRLSAERAGAAAACLVQNNVVLSANLIYEGGGVLDMPRDRAAQARRASVYFSMTE